MVMRAQSVCLIWNTCCLRSLTSAATASAPFLPTCYRGARCANTTSKTIPTFVPRWMSPYVKAANSFGSWLMIIERWLSSELSAFLFGEGMNRLTWMFTLCFQLRWRRWEGIVFARNGLSRWRAEKRDTSRQRRQRRVSSIHIRSIVRNHWKCGNRNF